MSIFNNTSPKPGADTSKDTVTAGTMLWGVTAHDKNGLPVVGAHVCSTGALQEKTITSSGVFTPDAGYTGFSKVTVIAGVTDRYHVGASTSKINPPTVQVGLSFNKNAVVRSYTVTATVSASE